jgi:hypothetical protein
MAQWPFLAGRFLIATCWRSLYATSTTGQIYYISAAGATPVSLGFTTGTAVDGPLGQIAPFTPAATPTLTPSNYKLQNQAGGLFDPVNAFAAAPGAAYTALAAPYTVAPFGGTKVFAAPAGGVLKATGGIVLVPANAAASAVITPDSILFVDTAGAGGKHRRNNREGGLRAALSFCHVARR